MGMRDNDGLVELRFRDSGHQRLVGGARLELALRNL
jgi:hypothetical protein